MTQLQVDTYVMSRLRAKRQQVEQKGEKQDSTSFRTYVHRSLFRENV